jgi:CRP-like cAMP-binding protein
MNLPRTQEKGAAYPEVCDAATSRIARGSSCLMVIYEVDQAGDEITLSVVEDGNVFGEMALTAQSLKGLYVRAITPSTVVSLRREDLEHLIMNKPEVGLRLVRELAQRLHASEARFADTVLRWCSKHDDAVCRLPRIILPRTPVNKPPTDAAGLLRWHHARNST